MMKVLNICAALILTAVLIFSACKKDEGGTGPGGGGGALVFVGTVNGDNGTLSGSITLSVNDTAVTGNFNVVTPSSANHALSGMYNTGAMALSASGGGYNFSGIYDGANRLEGLMSGAASGTFVAARDESNSAEAFCGTFSGDDSGVWNFTIDGTTIIGSYTTSSGSVGALDGSVSGSAITINNPGGGAPLATGTRSGNSVSGTWDDGQGSTGTWTGTRCN